MFSGRLSVRPLTPVSRVLSGGISLKLATNIHRVSAWELSKRFPRSEVKGQGHYRCEWYNG